ncbi:CO(2)-response secreted protease [Beta vulgaris subsp. vulgaris]|uniref:CO(2)-response secreted protease n=1 Tax=Beta vulgaris subsp. vulgaris TaxID=3555 RepID=UPI002036A1F1|nr:CO(2)-response secreted protease [Beta vulgaris subsp. vulgaris]
MKISLFYLFSYFVLLHYHINESTASPDNGDIYIIYMGSNKNSYDVILSSLLRRNKNALVHSYKHGLSGFAAHLSDSEAHQLTNEPGVVSVFPDPVYQLHTTRSWDFLQREISLLTDSQPRSNAPVLSSQGSDTIIGILDTGIWPESESFIDKDMGPIPSRWKGKCMEGSDFSSSNCSKKLIGARYYKDDDISAVTHSARDTLGHGTHVASTAAGVPVANASYYGLARGEARGGSPSSRIAMYRVCYDDGCPGSAILAAFDDAIADGVDLLSLSLGSSAVFAPDFATDPIAIGSFHAVEKGITVVCSAGNDGPSPQTVVNVAPWILTVAASTIDRDLQSDIILGNNKVIKGESINFSDLDNSPKYPLVSGGAAKSKSASEEDARNCYPDSIDADKIKGKLVLCQHKEGGFSMRAKQMGVKSRGGLGMIFINDATRLVASNWGTFPVTVITSTDATEILDYINATENSVATILATKTIQKFQPAPTVAYFSARGPSTSTKNILKPDISAPGVSIIAAWLANDTSAETTPEGREPPKFNVLSGTSMSCPHVAGIAANIKSHNPSWSPAALRSAIMTTASQNNNMKEPITTQKGEVATPYDFGAGEVSPTGGLQPGLVYDIEPSEYLQFLCYYGYNITTIKLIAAQIPSGFSCPSNSSTNMISNINYPSIAVSMNGTTAPITVKRTVTNVDADEETIYTVTVDKPSEVEVTVSPSELKFTVDTKKLDYQVTFSASSSSAKRDLFGAITWKSKKYKVRSPIVVIP